MKDKVKEGKNKMWELKCKEVDSMIGGSHLIEVWHFLKNLPSNFQDSETESNHHEGENTLL
jgi:hypothetical protein